MAVVSVIEFRRLRRTEASRVVEIDRRESIDVRYDQHGTQLVARRGDWSAPAWDPDGFGEHSVEAQGHTLEHYIDTGGIALGAFASGRLVGIGVVVSHLRPGIAQLAFLHVSAPWRATGVGSRLSEQLDLKCQVDQPELWERTRATVYDHRTYGCWPCRVQHRGTRRRSGLDRCFP